MLLWGFCAKQSQALPLWPQYEECHLRSCGRSEQKDLVSVVVCIVCVIYHCSWPLVEVILAPMGISRYKLCFIDLLAIEVHEKLAVWVSPLFAHSISRNGSSVVPRSSWKKLQNKYIEDHFSPNQITFQISKLLWHKFLEFYWLLWTFSGLLTLKLNLSKTMWIWQITCSENPSANIKHSMSTIDMIPIVPVCCEVLVCHSFSSWPRILQFIFDKVLKVLYQKSE